MLTEARATPSTVHWAEMEIEAWSPDEIPDLVYSNATLHWVGDHHILLPRLAAFVTGGGCLAIQMPLSWDLVSHQLMRQTLADGGGAGRPLGAAALRQAVGRKWVEEPDFYYDLLSDRVRSLDIWEAEYIHELEGDDPVFEWVKGSSLRPVLTGLPERERAAFLKAYRARLREAYPKRPNGRTLYKFRRLFIVALV
jgi:trans-aconitate 2-methyltransferase